MFTFVKNNDMKEKITFLMKSEGLTTTRLAEILEIQPSAVSHLVSGRNKPGYDLLQRILRRFPKINPDWLLLDSGEPFRVEQNTAISSGDDDPDKESLSGNTFDISMLRGGTRDSVEGDTDQVMSSSLGGGRSAENQNKGGKSPIFVVVFYSDGSCENFSMR